MDEIMCGVSLGSIIILANNIKRGCSISGILLLIQSACFVYFVTEVFING